ncbi:MAG: hypothetical protein LBL87_04085 [Ruminococcus sp.]|jgi:hypothetical protein|nr:hypothetical protein [Ruminococcus sp.]
MKKIMKAASLLTAAILSVSLFAVPVSAQDNKTEEQPFFAEDALPYYAADFNAEYLPVYNEWREAIINGQPEWTYSNLRWQGDADFIMKSMSMFLIYDPLTSHVDDFDVEVKGKVATVSITYKMNKAEYDEAMTAADLAYKEISKTFGESANTALKVKKIHDWLADNINYSIEAKHSDNLHGAFVGGLAKCDGYAKAFSYLLTRSGIENTVVIGETRDTTDDAGHAWSKVKIGKSWYIIDVTNNDTTENIGFIIYDYFMIPDSEYAAEFIERDDPYVKEPIANNADNTYYRQKKLVANDAQTAVNLIQTQAKKQENLPFIMSVQLTSSKEYDRLIEMLYRDTTLFTDYIKIRGVTMTAYTLRNPEYCIVHIVVKNSKDAIEE